MDNVATIKLRDPLHIKVVSEDDDYIRLLRGHFEYYVDGFRYTPQYRSGSWNGKTNLMKLDGSLPYGLLTELIRVNKKEFPRVTLIVEEEVKELFNGDKLTIKQDLTLKPYPYQLDCIQKALHYTKGIVRSATASGKSAVISYIIKTLLENSKIDKCIIVVPNTSLVEQFYKDMNDYGVAYNIGRVFAKSKEWDEPIVIATWQTLRKNHDKLSMYDCVIVDECHGSSAYQLQNILVKAVNATYRLGFTGTLHSGKLDLLNTQAYLGPVIADYSSGELAEQGYIAKCKVEVINIEYSNEYAGTYDEVKDDVFRNTYRLGIIKHIINKLDHNVLLLVGKVEKEGDYLKNWLSGTINKEIVFLSGRDSIDEREKWRQECMKRKDIALIATYPLFAQGVNIPNLQYLLLISPLKSKIRVLQSIGRALRKHIDKKNGAIIYDIHDHVVFLDKHNTIRFRYYVSEGFNINEYFLNEGDFLKNIP
jgi:superfamily II DNA or RNA helicase